MASNLVSDPNQQMEEKSYNRFNKTRVKHFHQRGKNVKVHVRVSDKNDEPHVDAVCVKALMSQHPCEGQRSVYHS